MNKASRSFALCHRFINSLHHETQRFLSQELIPNQKSLWTKDFIECPVEAPGFALVLCRVECRGCGCRVVVPYCTVAMLCVEGSDVSEVTGLEVLRSEITGDRGGRFQ
jgi:hypothetical protein